MKCGLKSRSRFNMDVKTLSNGVMDVKILNNGKKPHKFCCKVWDDEGWGCLGSKDGICAGKSSCTHWGGIEQPCSILCAAQVLPPEYSVKAVEIKAWLLLRKRMTHNVNFFFFLMWEEGLNSMFSFLAPSCCSASLCGRAGWRADNESAEMWLLIQLRSLYLRVLWAFPSKGAFFRRLWSWHKQSRSVWNLSWQSPEPGNVFLNTLSGR